MRTLRDPLAVALAIAAAACAPPPPAPPVAPPAPPPPAPAAPSPPPLGKRASGLQVVLDVKKTIIPITLLAIDDATVHLRPMRGRTFVTFGDVLFYVDGDTLRTDPALQRGITDLPRTIYLRLDLGAMGGHWPDGAWVQADYFGERLFEPSFLRWNGEEWVRATGGGPGVATDILPLANGWSAARFVAPWSYGYHLPTEIALLHPRWGEIVSVRQQAESIATLPDGSLYTAVDGQVALFAPDGQRVPIPSPAYPTKNEMPVASTIVPLSPTSIYLLNVLDEERGKSMALPETTDPPRPAHQLLHFDGHRWRTETTPAPKPDRIFAGPRGSLWVGQANELYERAPDGTWSSLEVPARLDQVWVASDDDVWATSGGTLLLHTRPLPAGLDLAAIVPPAAPSRFNEWCHSLTALLDEVPRTSPKDFDFHAQIAAYKPALGALDRRVAFYDLLVAGKRRLAAHVSNLGWLADPEAKRVRSMGETLVAKAEARGVPKPRLVCIEKPDEADDARLVRAAPAPPTEPATPPPPPPRARPAPIAGCASPMVILFAPAKTAPKDFDFPATRRALKGHTELSKVRFFDFQRQGKRVIAATAPDKPAALALIAAVEAGVPGSHPALVCEPHPAGAREVVVDLATGNVKK